MSQPLSIIVVPMPFGMGRVNCYLLAAGEGHVLIDTGAPSARGALERELERLGCRPGALSLIVLTHGDFDHIGNAAHIRRAFGSRIAMHPDDAEMARLGDMFVNRRRSSALLRFLIPRLIGFGKSQRFVPDVLLQDGASLREYGLEATVLSIPGHSSGSIGILAADGRLFCGDLLNSTKRPALNSLMDDVETARRSVARLRSMRVGEVYPGHGKPFSMDEIPEVSA